MPPRVELPKPRHSALTDPQFKTLRASFPGIDIDEMERQFVEWLKEKREGVGPENYSAALYGFIRKKLRREKAERARSLSTQDRNVTRRAK